MNNCGGRASFNSAYEVTPLRQPTTKTVGEYQKKC